MLNLFNANHYQIVDAERYRTEEQFYSKPIKEEFAADAIAYDMILKSIIEQKKWPENERIIEEYTYLAPVMFFKFFD